MPKRQNHPHHHTASERAGRESGLQLPQPQTWTPPGAPRWRYPAGWVTRPFWRSANRGALIFGFVWAAILLLAIIISAANR